MHNFFKERVVHFLFFNVHKLSGILKLQKQR